MADASDKPPRPPSFVAPRVYRDEDVEERSERWAGLSTLSSRRFGVEISRVTGELSPNESRSRWCVVWGMLVL